MSERWLWTQKEDIGPSPRWGAAMAYETARRRVVLFGGTDVGGSPFNDTWEWDGRAWTQVADIGPSGRWFSGMTYDDSRQRLVLFGGNVLVAQSYRINGDTWEWNGTEWTQVADAGPPYRSYPAMVFDNSRECLVLFGGYGGSTHGWLGDTWEWDDATGWVKRRDIGPRSMVEPKMVYTGERTVLVGAPAADSAAEHTWEWDGRLWTQRQDMGPPLRTRCALAYDGQRDRVVLFGGFTSVPQTIALGDTWELAIIEQPG